MTDSPSQPHIPSLLLKYRSLIAPYRRELVLGLLALAVTNGLGILIPLQIQQAIDTLQNMPHGSTLAGNPAWAAFYSHLWMVGLLALLVLAARVGSRIYLLGAGRRIEFDLRNRLYGHLLKMPTSYYAAHPAGELMSRITNDVDAAKFLTGGGLMLGTNTVLAYVLTIPMMLYLNWKLALVTFLFYPIVVNMMRKISKRVRTGFFEVQTVLAEISTTAQENLSGMTVIQSYVLEKQEKTRFEAICEKYFDSYTRLIHERILLFMILAALSGVSALAVLTVGGWEVIAKQLNWGGFVAYTMYLEQLAWPTMALGWTISIFQQGIAALQRIDSVLITEPTIPGYEAEEVSAKSDVQPTVNEPVLPFDSSFQGKIEIRDLTFAYQNPYGSHEAQIDPGQSPTIAAQGDTAVLTPVQPALRDVNLTIEAGKTVAFVGPVGSGKSTLLRLLPHLYEIESGHIFLDGHDIATLDPDVLRTLVVMMPQQDFLFSTTVSQNIAFGKPDILATHAGETAPALPEASLREAAEIASVHLDIQELPQQYQTLVGERGLMLSGGQRQRVALARALLVTSPVLILDDPFSNIDAETERVIVNALQDRQVFQQRTTLIATHRFSLVALCDQVVLMDAGRVIATGTPAEMMATQPLYQKLHRLQELRTTLGDWEGKPAAPLASAMDEEDDD